MAHAPHTTSVRTQDAYRQPSRGVTPSSRLYAPLFASASFTDTNLKYPLLPDYCASVRAYMRIYAILNAFFS